ncbi:MAG: protein kinase, partial [Pirellulaceae bacterium]|nr:protein kinase [Pirellulaceae bacterium]
MLATKCYPRDVLERYLQGQIDDELSEAIEEHLESCADCEDTVSELDSIDDSLIRTLQLKPSEIDVQPPPWVDRIAGLSPDAAENSVDIDAMCDDAIANPQGLGDYDLLNVLGRGGMSIVFAARHKHLGREVALKVLLPTAQNHNLSRERFTREMRAVGRLDHASIIRATDAGEIQDTLYLVMDRIDGVDLKHVSRRQGPLSIADACAIGVEVARGLQHAHAQGVVHRDIKPSNLMLDRDGNLKILDFGLARMQSSGRDVTLQTTIGQLLGTLDYMAPEQASGNVVDARADIYALGATLYKLIVGTPPHGRSTDIPIIEFLHRLANESVQPMDAHRGNLPSELVDLIQSMLNPDPMQRIRRASEVAERLGAFADAADLKQLVADVPVGDSSDSETSDQESLAAARVSLGQMIGHTLNASGNDDVDGTSQSSGQAVTAGSGSGRRNGWPQWIAIALASASFFGLILLGVSILLKTPEGDFRVESDVLDNITVEVVDEQNRVSLIAVDSGQAETTLSVGRYRVRLNSPSDEIQVTPDTVVVSNKQAAIVKVTRIAKSESPAPSTTDQQRDPNAVLQAQVELMQVVEQLNVAKSKQDPDDESIRSLEIKAAALRALTRPIPTEPVYQGRTLADWIAQMRYEQQPQARATAVQSVIALAMNLPDQEKKMALAFEAGARADSWDSRELDERL